MNFLLMDINHDVSLFFNAFTGLKKFLFTCFDGIAPTKHGKNGKLTLFQTCLFVKITIFFLLFVLRSIVVTTFGGIVLISQFHKKNKDTIIKKVKGVEDINHLSTVLPQVLPKICHEKPQAVLNVNLFEIHQAVHVSITFESLKSKDVETSNVDKIFRNIDLHIRLINKVQAVYSSKVGKNENRV